MFTNTGRRNLAKALRMECRRFLSVRNLLVSASLIGLIYLVSVSDSLSLRLIGAPASSKMSICDKFQENLMFDRYKSLFVLAASMFVVTAYAKEEESHFFRYLLLRNDIKTYVTARVILIFIYVPLCMILGTLLGAVSVLPFSVIYGKGSIGYGVYSFLSRGNLAWLYLVVMAWNLGLSIVPVCCVGVLASVWIPNRYVALGSTFFVYYLLYAMTNLMPYFLSYSYLSSDPGLATWFGMPYRFFVYLLLTLCVGKGIHKALVWRKNEGIL